MAMAGLLFQQGSQSRFVIMTSAADGKLAEIHHRQPLVLAKGTEMQWLGGTANQAAKYCEITNLAWDKSRVEISQNFVAFSEYMNFNIRTIKLSKHSPMDKIFG